VSDLRKDVERKFGSEGKPRSEELVNHDGYDELEKADALKSFRGRSWETVYRYLLQREPGWSNTNLEEWSCLEPGALRYFLTSYLLYLFHTLGQARPDDEFVSYFHFQLSEVLRLRGRNIFNEEQRALLARVASEVLAKVENSPAFDIWRNDIRRNVNKCLSFF
jgi:hypothetical protein